MPDDQTSKEISSPEEVFLSFHYPEIKDWAKQFLTVVAGTLVLSLTFADKMIGDGTPYNLLTRLLGAAWLFMLVAIGSAGGGIYFVFRAGAKASGLVFFKVRSDFQTLARRSLMLLIGAGISFCLSLLLLAVAGAVRFL